VSTPPETITARYMTRFQCIGGACEDNCCHGWNVEIDQRHYQILRRSMERSKAEREEFRQAVKRTPDNLQSESNYARIQHAGDSEKNCPFLTGQKLCSVQGRYGERALPQVCSTYPRSIYRLDDRLEVWGMLSCPEMVRQCLLHEDSMDLVDGTPGLSPRLEPTTGFVGARAPYERYVDDIRGAAFKLLSLRDYPIATRLFLLAYLGKQTAGFFNVNTGAVDEAKLVAAIEQVSDQRTVELWNRELATLPASEALTANLVSELISERLKDKCLPVFRTLVEQTMASYGQVSGASLANLWSAYSARRKSWLESSPARIDLYFENYAKNYWMREWYVLSPDLLAHTRRLLVRVAVLRFLLFSHPSLIAAATLEPAARQEALDRAAVEVFYKFSRAIEHDSEFIDAMTRRLVEQGAGSFTHAAILALV
jgi:lysine-N-methylase